MNKFILNYYTYVVEQLLKLYLMFLKGSCNIPYQYKHLFCVKCPVLSRDKYKNEYISIERK